MKVIPDRGANHREGIFLPGGGASKEDLVQLNRGRIESSEHLG